MKFSISSVTNHIKFFVFLLSIASLFVLSNSSAFAEDDADEELVTRRGFHLWPIFDFRTETGEDYLLRTRKVWPLFSHQRRETETGWYASTKALDLLLFNLYKHVRNDQGSESRTVFPFSWGSKQIPFEQSYFQFLLYRSESDASGLNNHLLFPLFLQWQGEKDKGVFLFPFMRSYEKSVDSESEADAWELAHFWAFPIYFWSKDRVAVTPLIWKGKSGHGFAPIYTVYDHGEGRSGRSFLWPFFQFDNDKELHKRKILWPLYSSESMNQEHLRRSLFGLLYLDYKTDSVEAKHLLQVMRRFREIDPLNEEILMQSKTIFPIWSHRTDYKGSNNYNFLNLFPRHSAVEGERTVSMLMDLLMYRKLEDQYMNWNFVNLPYTNQGGVISYTRVAEQSIREPEKKHLVFLAPLYSLAKRIFGKNKTENPPSKEDQK